LLGLGLLKFGNPVILDRLVEPPGEFLEFVVQPWPVAWGYALLAVVGALGLAVAVQGASAAAASFRGNSAKRQPVGRPSRAGQPAGQGEKLAQGPPGAPGGVRPTHSRRRWLILLPVVWLAWQFVAAATTVNGWLTRVTLVHFVALVAGFGLAFLALARVQRLGVFWAGLLGGFLLMLWSGFDQHYGGLEATRRYIYSLPGWENLAPEHLKRIGSDRIFATLLYPNALAGVLLLLSPAMLAVVWLFTSRLPRIVRAVMAGLLAYASGACLVWSGSKAGWLIALALGLVGLLQLPFRREFKTLLVVAVVVGGLAGFFVKFSGYFAKGATSVGARLEYWRAGWKTALSHPLVGAGPGTFSVSYRKLKPPQAEMAQLTHNDYLEQACDSGFPGALAYLTFVAGSVAGLYRRCRRDLLQFAVWLGLLGWALQSGLEFGLYIPAVGWTAFWLLGWLWGVNQFDKPGSPT
jgi:hypothetical protein